MSRRVIVKAKEIWKARADNYATYLEMHSLAMTLDANYRAIVIQALEQMPYAVVNIKGYADASYPGQRKWYYWDKVIELQLIKLDGPNWASSEFFNKWLWTAAGWNQYVTDFNALPEPEPAYEVMLTGDHITYEPLAYNVSKPVDKPVYNSGTTAKLYQTISRKK